MKKLLFPMALAVLFVPGAAAQNIFEGTWKMNMSNIQYPDKPEEYLLQDGISTCKTCDPPSSLKADGIEQPLVDNLYYDAGVVKVVNDHRIQVTNKKNGKVIQTVDIVVSPDGDTLTQEWVATGANSGAPPASGKNILKHVAKGPPGSHLISGSWRFEKMENVSDNDTQWTYKVNGDELTMTSPRGEGFTARFDGTEAPYKGDPGTTSVRVKLIGTDTLEETDLREGKIVYVSRMTISRDGKKAKIVSEDKRQNTTTSFEAVKQ